MWTAAWCRAEFFVAEFFVAEFFVAEFFVAAERAGVRWGIPEEAPICRRAAGETPALRLLAPVSPSRTCGVGPCLSPVKGGEGRL